MNKWNCCWRYNDDINAEEYNDYHEAYEASRQLLYDGFDPDDVWLEEVLQDN